MSLLVVGTVAYDDITTPRGRAPRILGGSGTYIALAASFFTPVRVVAVVGEDLAPQDEAVLVQRGISTAGLERIKGGKCFFWACTYESNPNIRHTTRTDLNVFEHFVPKLPAEYLDSKVVFVGNFDPKQQSAVCDQVAPGRPFIGGDTMNYWISGQPDEVKKFLSRIQLLTVNDQEAMQLTGDHNLHRAAKAMLKLGPKAVVIKRGEHGATLYTGEGYFGIAGYPLEDVYDPTGAGDAFAGGMLGYLARANRFDDRALRQAVVYGSVMGSFACERFGVERLTQITSDDIRARYLEFTRMAHFHEAEAAGRA